LNISGGLNLDKVLQPRRLTADSVRRFRANRLANRRFPH